MHLDLLALDMKHAAAGEVDVDLLLARAGLVVLEALRSGRQIELVDTEGRDAERPAHLAERAVATLAGLDVGAVDDCIAHAFLLHIRKTPKVVSGIGALRLAAIPRARARRVSSGSRIPSSHSRAVE